MSISGTTEGRIALHAALRARDKDIIDVMIAGGADINAKDNQGNTPLMYAMNTQGNINFDALMAYNPDLNIRNNEGLTPVHQAAICGNSHCLNALLERGGKLDAKDRENSTPMYYARYYGHDNAAEALLERGARDVRYTDDRNIANQGEAKIWYLGHSGWAIKTKNNLLIFDYWRGQYDFETPSLSNGMIDPDEIKNENVYVFCSHHHQDHWDPIVFDWNLPNATYIFGHNPAGYDGFTFMEPRQTKTFGDLEVTTIKATDAGVAFMVKVDGLTIYHAGDHGNMDAEIDGPYEQELIYLHDKGFKPDIAFLPISGCNFGNVELVKEGVYYFMDKMKPGVLIPMHSGNNEQRYRQFADEAAEKGYKTDFFCAENRGDRFNFTKDTKSR